MRRRRQAGECRGGRPEIHVGGDPLGLAAGRDVARPGDDGRHPPTAFEAGPLHAAERLVAGVGIGVDPGAVVDGPQHDGVLVHSGGAQRLQHRAGIGVHLHERVEIHARMGPALEVRRHVGRIVHLGEGDVHEHRLGVVRVRPDIGGRIGGLLLVDGREVGIGEMLDDAPRRLPRFALPHAVVHLAPIGRHELRIVARKVGVQVGVSISVNPGVVGEEILHGVETVIDRHGVDGVAQVPFSREIGLVIVLLEEFRDGRCLRPDPVGIAGRDDHREGGAHGQASGHERGAAGGAACLPIPFRERRSLGRQLVEVRGRRVARLAAAIDAEVPPAGIVGHDHDDVGPFLLRLGAHR